MSDLPSAILSDEEVLLQEEEDDDEEEEESEDEFVHEFEFGGLLGEDGDNTHLASMLSGSGSNSWSYKSALKILEQNDNHGISIERTNVASIIAAARKNLKKKDEKVKDEKEETTSESSADDDDDSDHSDEDDKSDSDSDTSSDSDSSEDEVDDAEMVKTMEVDTLKDKKSGRKRGLSRDTAKEEKVEQENSDDEGDSSSDDEEAKKERVKASQFFDSAQDVSDNIEVFAQLNLSRPLLRGVASIGFVTPTPIQVKVIPIALSGRDVCASAQTGSGKTAAFLLPIMERILQRGGGKVQMKSKKGNTSNAIRGLVLTPTRELAAQCLGMMTAMAKFTDLRATLIVGGAKNLNAQAAELRTRPDIVIATPGRLIDHLTNSAGVDLDDLEFLVLDEADRLLDLGFQDEVHEIIKSCPVERQTLLFSATMGTKVDDLIKLSLKRPVRVHVSGKKNSQMDTSVSGRDIEVANRLEQEFIRVRASNDGINRESMLLALLTRTFTSRVIVFFDTKATAHRLMIICGLCGIKCAELHGNLTQLQRLEALEEFREGVVDVLLATDLAARGLDIPSVEAVINFEMPTVIDTYVHRIGRTARAGRGGKACTLIGESRRNLMKAVIKDAEQKRKSNESKSGKSEDTAYTTGAIRSRTIPGAVLKHFTAKIVSLESKIKEVMEAELVAKMDRIAEMEMNKAQNIIEHGSDIKSRPQREWFMSEKSKVSAKERYLQKQQEIAEKVGKGTHRMTRKKRRMREAKEEIRAMQEEAQEGAQQSGQRSKTVMTDNEVKSTAKAHKKKIDMEMKEKDYRSVNDEDIEYEKKQNRKSQSKKRKGAFGSDSLGDSGLFEDERISHEKKKTKETPKVATSSYEFKGYNPEKKRKNKEKSHHGFKSKSKHKRR